MRGKTKRESALVRGVVQGVGFRPFVYNLARGLGLTGWVLNDAAGVELAVQGGGQAVEEFFARLTSQAPPLAAIHQVERREAPPEAGESEFVIRASAGGRRRTLISPDVAVCEACLAEMLDPADRRHGYPFINCTHCGPRYTIIQDLPYDRPMTTMQVFTMCPDCQAEYEDPGDRRFHAQPNACPKCGPRLWLADAQGAELPGDDPVAEAAQALAAGEVLGVKGLGGFHLAADAANDAAVARLRGRKHREEKPLAVMVPGLDEARALAELDDAEAEALASRERPIVLVPCRENAPLAPSVAPNNRLIGLMLPYTPLHHLLLNAAARRGLSALVMTSGNVSDEPICLDNHEAVCRIGAQATRGAIVDKLLLHDRDIHLRSDDSVVRVVDGSLRAIRRSRGFVPSPLILAPGTVPSGCPPVLAAGAHQKNTLCLLRGDQAFISQHVGDLDDLRTLEFFELTAAHLARVLEAEPEIIACDLHPDYLSSKWAAERGLPLVRVQHHHAHAVAVMAEHGLSGEVLGVSLDGTGYGDDASVWGGELLAAHGGGYRRLGRLRRFALPGGEAAVRQPWRVGWALLEQVFGPQEAASLALGLVERRGESLALMSQMTAKGLNSPLTSSLGRLFDGVAALCGLREEAAYEGQAAIELEQAMDQLAAEGYPMALREQDGLLELDWGPTVEAVVAEVLAGSEPGLVSARFHAGLLAGLSAWVQAGAELSGLDRACLGGGCFMNACLLTGLPAALESAGLAVYTAAQAPANDGGLSLGQAVAAAHAWDQGLDPGGVTTLTPQEGSA
ncbi:MAG: carbamoyltransferase HypF [Desulfarculaceae bacterium]|nr:carbamoyltransferase HypF [Desulfarculaceae bacterium]MCF8073111.1 carbamoyltransferase HypF [Desulfarculaceae bacterium]MCF8117368.1 carbamoyltransferase HypF [Desulfarculaceae bacterium]